MSHSLMIVFTNAVDGQDEAFNEWYDTQHLSDVVACPGVRSARRYELAQFEPPSGENLPSLPSPSHRYLAVYELDGEPNQVMAEFVRRMEQGKMPLSDAFDLTTVSMMIWSPRETDPVGP